MDHSLATQCARDSRKVRGQPKGRVPGCRDRVEQVGQEGGCCWNLSRWPVFDAGSPGSEIGISGKDFVTLIR